MNAKLEAIRSNPDYRKRGWDGRKAMPVTDPAIDLANQVLRHPYFSTPDWRLGPSEDGGIRIEPWNADISLDIEVLADCAVLGYNTQWTFSDREDVFMVGEGMPSNLAAATEAALRVIRVERIQSELYWAAREIKGIYQPRGIDDANRGTLRVLNRTLRTMTAEIILSRWAGADPDRCWMSGDDYTIIVDDAPVPRVLSTIPQVAIEGLLATALQQALESIRDGPRLSWRVESEYDMAGPATGYNARIYGMPRPEDPDQRVIIKQGPTPAAALLSAYLVALGRLGAQEETA